MTKRQKQGQKTKTAIMDSALDLFREFGFDSVTVEQITRNAGVAKGSFYTYFSTKSDIIVEEFWSIDAYYRMYAGRNLRRYATAREKLLAFTRAQMRYVRDVVGNTNLKILYANQTIQPGSDKIIVNRERYWHTLIRETIELGRENGEFRSDLDAERLTVLFNRSVRSVFLDWCISDASFDLVKEGVAFIEEWILSALQNAPRE